MSYLYALLSRWMYHRDQRRRCRPPRRRTTAAVAFHRPWPGTLRGLCLWFLGIAFVVLGTTNYLIPDLTPRRAEDLAFALTLSGGSLGFWGLLMAGVGAACIFCSYCHFGRDRIGYVIAVSFSGGWGIGYLCGLFYDAGPSAIGGAAIWLLFAAIFTTVAAFPNVSLSGPPLLEPDAEQTRDGEDRP